MSSSSLLKMPFGLWQETKSLLGLAWPVILSRAGMFSLSVVDTIMVGQYAASELAYLSVGQVPIGICILLSVGLLIGTMVLSANHFGAGQYEQCSVVWWRSLPLALLIGFSGLIICLFSEFFLSFFGQPPDIAQNGGRISLILGLSLPLVVLNITTSFFLESINKVKPGMVIMIIANVLNVLLNNILINGGMGIEPMGAQGSAWSTLLVRLVQLLLILGFVWTMHDWQKFGVRKRPSLAWRHSARQREIGYAAGLSIGVANISFSTLILFAGIISTIAVAGFSITFNVFTLCFMLGLGVGTATSVKIGNAYGARNMPLVRQRGWIGLGVQLCLMLPITFAVFVFAPFLVSVYTNDVQVAYLATVLLKYAVLAVALDAGQALMAQALRARQDIWASTLIQFFSFSLIMIPLAYLSAFIWGRGVIGLIDGWVVGTFMAIILGVVRFVYLAKQDETKAIMGHL